LHETQKVSKNGRTALVLGLFEKYRDYDLVGSSIELGLSIERELDLHFQRVSQIVDRVLGWSLEDNLISLIDIDYFLLFAQKKGQKSFL
jgi:hypothetical protein